MITTERAYRKYDGSGKAGLLLEVLALTICLALITWNFPALGAEGNLEGFNLYRYPEEKNGPSWTLSGVRAKRDEGSLIVYRFRLRIMDTDSGKEELLYELSGDKLKLDDPGGRTEAFAPGEIEITMERGLQGTGKEVRYNFATGELTGDDLEVKNAGPGGKMTLSGTEFSYNYESGVLNIEDGFRVRSDDPGETRSVITGRSLSWPRKEEIMLSGDISARLGSGWMLESDNLTWWPEKGVFESKKGGRIEREGTRIEGNKIKYEASEEKLLVSGAKMVIGDD